MSETDFAKIMPQVAELVLGEFLGQKNKHLSTSSEWRWGTNGSVAVDLPTGQWFDHEDQTGGGVIALLQAFKGYDEREAVEWLVERGFMQPREQRSNDHAGDMSNPFAARVPKWMDPKPVAIFEYFDDKGHLAFEVLKFPKTAFTRFQQRRRHRDGGWIWGLKERVYGKTRDGDWRKPKEGKHYAAEELIEAAPRWLYRRDEVMKAKAEGRPIILVGGEKDADTVREWGFTATTNAGGEKYWQDSFDDDLAGADIVICGDNDSTGRIRTLRRGAGLKPRAKSVRVIDLALHWPEIGEKDDVTDWKEKGGGTAEMFAALVERAPHWTPERPRSRYGAFTWDQLDTPGLEQDYLVEGWWTERGRSVIGGPSKSGKSFLAIHYGMSVARGTEFFGLPVKRGGVIYQAGEGGWGIKKRFRAYREYYKVPADEDVPIVPLTGKVNLYAKDGDTQPLIDEIKAWKLVMSQPLRLVIIDTLSTATAGANENDGKDMSIVLGHIARIEEECGVHVCLVHHMNADGKKLRGHTSIYANVDQVVLVAADPNTKIRTALLDKQKDDEDGLKLTFSLASVVVGRNEKIGRDITSCVVLTVDEKEKLKKEQEQFGFSVRPSEEKILTPLFKAIDRYGKFVATEKDGPAEAIGKQVVDFGYYLDVAVEMDAGDDDKPKAKDRLRKAFESNNKFLLKAGVIGFNRPYVWWTGKPIRGYPRTFPEGSRFRRNPGETSEDVGINPGIPESAGIAEIMNGEAELPW